MSKRGVIRTALIVALTIGVVIGAVTWWTRPRVIEVGSSVVFVEGREIGLGGGGFAGVGVAGTLGLVGDTCVGLIQEAGRGVVIVWPSDTTVSGSGDSLAITSQGTTVHLGDEVEGGTRGLPLSEFESRLPKDCEGFPLVDLGLAQ